MELADMRDLGSRVERRGGSSPFIRTSTGVVTELECCNNTRYLSRFFSGA